MENWEIWVKNLAERISWNISKSGDEPLDGGETDRLGRLFTLELDRCQGNLSDEEYEECLRKIEKKGGI